MQLPAGQFVKIGNPLSLTDVVVTSADAVYVYVPGPSVSAAGTYRESTTLHHGQGAFAYSAAGATVTISPASP